MRLPVMPPVKPMLAKPVKKIPAEGHSFEPKWDGFRAIVFRDGDTVEIGSRNERFMTRYFPELVTACRESLPTRCVVDGEIVLVADSGDRLDFDVLQQRIHPAQSRIDRLAAETPASFVGFDLLALDDTDYTPQPFSERRRALESALSDARPPIHLTPATTDAQLAQRWFVEFEGAGLDGVIAKPLEGTYQPNKRVMSKIKHERTADCVLAGYRHHKSSNTAVGSLLLGLYNDAGELASVGVIGAFSMPVRESLFQELQPLVTDLENHPWAPAVEEGGTRTPQHAAASRWSAGKDLSFTPLRPERVVEVKFDHMEGDRFRHTAQFVRWRPDREPRSCTYEQLEQPIKFDLADVLGS